MADPFVWKIVDAVFGLSIVDTAAVGYLPSWQAPDGATLTTAEIADYDTGDPDHEWRCQVTAAGVTATPSTTTENVEATMCSPSIDVPSPAATSFGLDLGFLQDAPLPSSLAQFLWENDAEEAFVFVGYNGATAPPKVIGRVMLAASTLGGAMRSKLLNTITFPFTRKPEIAWPPTTVVVNGAAAPADDEAAEDEVLEDATT